MASTLEVMNAAYISFLLRPPLAIFAQSGAQSIGNTTDTAITWPAPSQDSYGGWSSGNPTRYTGKIPGYYVVTGVVSWATNATGNRLTEVHLNGNTTATAQAAVPATTTANNPSVDVVSNPIFLNGSTDYLELWGYQNSGGSLSTNPSQTIMTVRFFRFQ